MSTHSYAQTHAGEGSDLLYFRQITSAAKTKAKSECASVK